MKRLLIVLAACGGQSDDRPRCVDAFEELAKRLGDPGSPAISSMIGTCEHKRWSRAIRSCVADAKSADAAAKCIEPALEAEKLARDAEDKKGLGPAPVPSDDAKKDLAKGPLRVKWFAGDGKDPVSQHVIAYFKAAGITVEVTDRLVDAEAAMKYRVTREGTVVLVREAAEEEWQTIEIGLDLKRAKQRLAKLNREVVFNLAKLYREKRKLYVTTGHGEGKDAKPERRFSTFERRITELNFEHHELSSDVLAKEVPADATIVVILAPSTAFSAAEQASLDRYLDRGGGMIVAYDPKGIASLGTLDAKLGAKLAKGYLTDDKSFLPQRKTPADHRFVVTNQYSAHATTTAVSRTAQGTVLVEAGALETVATSAKTTSVVRSMESSFLDLDDDFTFDDRKEMRAHYPIAIASEGAQKHRAVVLADVDLFADALVPSAAGRTQVMMIGGLLVVDILRWVGGEEVFSGEVVVDDDEPEREKPNPGRKELHDLADLVGGH